MEASTGEVVAVDVVVVEEDVGDAVEGLASDGETVGAVDARVFDGDVGGCCGVGFYSDAVVAGLMEDWLRVTLVMESMSTPSALARVAGVRTVRLQMVAPLPP